MENLTTKQVTSLNKLFRFILPFLALGTILQEMITEINDDNNIPVTTGTPVNAANATKTLTISGVVLDGETVTIGDDVYEFAASDELLLGDEDNIPVDINDYADKAIGTLTIDTNPLSGDKFTIGTKVFTFVPIGTANGDGDVAVEATLGATQANVVEAIMGTDGFNNPHTSVECAAAFVSDDLVITAIIGGVAGNSIATTTVFTELTNVFLAITLLSGTDCSAANGVTALVAAITAFGSEAVGAVDGDGNTVVLTADVAGILGNSIPIAETMNTGAFAGAAVFLSGGVNGTVGADGEIYKDASYLYICVGVNTITDKNWRRVTLGSAY